MGTTDGGGDGTVFYCIETGSQYFAAGVRGVKRRGFDHGTSGQDSQSDGPLKLVKCD